jgi:SOS response regulatory protein OraA/RecX
MKTIESVIKKRGYIEVSVDDQVILFDDEIMMKYKLKVGVSIELSEWKLIRDENEHLLFYKLAIKKLKKMMTTHEMKVFLESKGASSSIISDTIRKLKSKKYLDDELYIKTYIAFKKDTYGPKKLEYELKQKGIPFEWIEKHLSTINEHEIIKDLIDKKLNSLKNKSTIQKKMSLKTYLLGKGFSLQIIDIMIQSLSFDDIDEQSNLKKDYEKLIYKFSHLQGYEREQKILTKLYQKGYTLSDIKKIMMQS